MEFRTLNELLVARVQASAEKRAYTFSKGGRWVDVSFAEMGREVDEVANGLLSLGLAPGDAVAILGETRPEWGNADLAVLACGARSAGIYQTNTPAQSAHILNDAGCRFVFVDSSEQLERIEQVRAGCAKLERAFLFEGRASKNGGFVITYEDLRALGREYAKNHPTALAARRSAVAPNDPAILIYTSGTTGLPKGAVLTHKNVCTLLKTFQRAAPITEDDTSIAFLPMAHSAEHIAGFFGRVAFGMPAVYARSLKTVVEDIQYAKPTILGAVPRIFEKVYAKVQADIAQQSAARRKIAHWAIGVGREVSRRRRAGQKTLPRWLALQHPIADRLVLSKVREAFGGRIRFCVTGAAPISLEILEFFHACGILILEAYGLTETSAIATINRPDDFRLGTVGKSLPGMQIRIANDGEILLKGDTVFAGYHNLEAETREAIDADGWFHSGDIGEFDRDGFLRITDRKKNLIVTAGGKNVAPANIEALLRRDTLFAHALALGDRRPYISALFAFDGENARKVAAELNISPDLAVLARDPRVIERAAKVVEAANADLARYEQVRRFAIAPAEFTPEGGELTPSLKVKRKVVEEKFKDLIDSLYRGAADASTMASG
jgi:long-chain acyl-CoA synthetase